MEQRECGIMGILVYIGILLLLSYGIIPSFVIRFVDINRRKKLLDETDFHDKTIYLTFDDGPSSLYTAELLALLKQYEIHATFFVVGEFANQNPKLLQQMKTDGHTIGMHSYCHKNAILQRWGTTYSDFTKTVITMDKLGYSCVYYRPPWGHINLCTLYMVKKLGVKMLLWDVMAQDWEKKATVDSISNKIMKRTTPGSVICLHDGRGAKGAPKKTIQALRITLPLLLEQGYRFGNLGETYGKKVFF